MRITVRAVFASASIILGMSPAAQATIISANFTGGNFGGAPTSLNATDTAGIGAFNAANWNNLDGNPGGPASLNDSTGTASGVTLTWGSTSPALYGSGTGTATGDAKMFNGYIDNLNNSTVTLTFSGLVPGSLWNVASYSLPDSLDGRTSDYGIGTDIRYLKSDNAASFQTFGYVPVVGSSAGNFTSGNTNEWDNIVADPSGNIVITAHADAFRAYFNGAQLASVATVPEPSSAVLMGIGCFAAAAFASRRRMAA